MILNELFNQTYEWEWKSFQDDQCVAVFYTEDRRRYDVVFDNGGSELGWEFYFALHEPGSQNPRTDITNTGNQFKVFATIVAMIKQAVQLFNITKFGFGGAGDENSSRIRLYDRFAKMFQQDGWNVEISVNAGTKYYHCTIGHYNDT